MEKYYPSITASGLKIAFTGQGAVVENKRALRWMPEQNARQPVSRALSANQLTSITAMIAYIAQHTDKTEFRIERELADHFNVVNAKLLPAQDFDKAIRYLADIFPPQP